MALATRIALFALALAIAGWFALRVRYNLKATEAAVSLNPFV
jgi:hypothetical protein